MCGFITLSFSAIIRGAATSQNWGVHPSSLPSSFPSSIPPSLFPCFPTLCFFLPFFISIRPWLSSFLNPSLPSSLFCPLFSLFSFSFLGGPPPATWSQLGVYGRAVSPAAKQFQCILRWKQASGEWWQQCGRSLHTTNVNYKSQERPKFGVSDTPAPFFGCPDSHDTQHDCVTVYGIKIKTIYLINLLLQITDSRNLSKFPSSSIFNCACQCLLLF